MISLVKEYDTDMVTLLHAAADFTYRHRWMEGVKKTEVQNHFLPRVGMRCIMTLDKGEKTVIASHYVFHEKEIEFSETEEDTGNLSHYSLEKLGDYKTKLTLNYYRDKNFLTGLSYAFGKKNSIKKSFEKSLGHLAMLVNEIGDSVRIRSQ